MHRCTHTQAQTDAHICTHMRTPVVTGFFGEEQAQDKQMEAAGCEIIGGAPMTLPSQWTDR